MRILHISNHSAPRCGIQNFGLQLSTALRLAGADVTDWDATYPVLHAREEQGLPGYLPDDWRSYDVLHLNWHPQALNTYRPEHFPVVPGGPIFSAFLHDIPPHSWCPVLQQLDVLITAEPWPTPRELHPAVLQVILPYPVPDWITGRPDPVPEGFVVGWTGVRGDGYEALRDLCAQENWSFNAPRPGGAWLSIEDEVRRLARSTINVCWYTGDRGLSGAASTCLASRRPLLINHSPMLRHLVGRAAGVLRAKDDESLSTVLLRLSHDQENWRKATSTPHLTWAHAADQLLEDWSRVRVHGGRCS